MAKVMSGVVKKQLTLKQQAQVRMDNFIYAIETQQFGPPPTPDSTWKVCLDECIRDCTTVFGTLVEVTLINWNESEIRYALDVCWRLGYKPEWD